MCEFSFNVFIAMKRMSELGTCGPCDNFESGAERFGVDCFCQMKYEQLNKVSIYCSIFFITEDLRLLINSSG